MDAEQQRIKHQPIDPIDFMCFVDRASLGRKSAGKPDMPARSILQTRPDRDSEPALAPSAKNSVLLYEASPNLSGVPDIFAGLSEAEIQRVVDAGRHIEFALGDHLFRQGERHEGIFILRAGAVRSYYVSPAGREITLANWTPGNFVGGPEIFGGGIHVWSGVAVKAGRAVLLPGSAVQKLMAAIPNFAVGLVHGLAFKGKCYSSLLQLLGTRSVIERLALVLLNLADRPETGARDAILISRAVSQEELAALVGATRQWISITLERFRKQGLLAVRDRRIVVLRPNELRAISVSQ